MKYELCIAVADEIDLHPVTKRKKQGEIICVRPYPWNWGRREIDEYFIVLVESAKTYEEISIVREGIWRHPENKKLISEAEANDLAETGEVPDYVDKNRFKIDISMLTIEIAGFDQQKMENKNYIYQPMKSKSQLVAKFDGLNNNRYLDPAEADTSCLAASDEEEIFIQIDGKIYDKLLDTYI